jgi:hypothetical protein
VTELFWKLTWDFLKDKPMIKNKKKMRQGKETEGNPQKAYLSFTNAGYKLRRKESER